MSVKDRLTHKFARAAAFAGATAAVTFAVGLSAPVIAGSAAAVGLVAASTKCQRALTNKFFVAGGVGTYALAAGFPVTGSGASLVLAGLAFTIKNSLAITASGYGGLLVPRIARGLKGHERKKYKVFAKEIAGTSAGLGGFMAGSAGGLALSGSPEADMDVIQYKLDTQGFLPAVEEVRDQINEIMIQGTAALDKFINGGKSLYDIFNHASDNINQKWYEIAREAAQIPEVSSAATVAGAALSMSIASYLVVRNMVFRKKDFEQDGSPCHHDDI